MTYYRRTTLPPGFTLVEILVIFIGLIVLAAFLYPLFDTHEHPGGARQTQCMDNVRQLIVATQMYQQDHKGKYPNQATIWQDIPFPPMSVICPTYGKNKGNGYGYNVNIAGKTLDSKGMPKAQNVVVMADSKTLLHQLSIPTDIDFRHTSKAVVGFADGHVSLLVLADIPVLAPKATTDAKTKANKHEQVTPPPRRNKR